MKLILKRSAPFMTLILTIFAVACGGPAETTTSTQSASDLPLLDAPEQPVVEYGASLEEWDEAVQENEAGPADADATDSAELMSTEDSPVDNEEIASSVNQGLQLNPDGEVVYQEVYWEALVPAEFSPQAIMAKYETELAQIADGSPEANDLYVKMQEEFNNAPVNETLNGAFVKIPGFIAPLEFTDETITEFLLVPYFGACIHVPAPPPSQTILVKTAEGHGISFADSYNPIWIVGMLTTEANSTELADAYYYMEDATIELYEAQ